MHFRLISLNILSSALSRPSYFPKCRPDHCDPQFRMALLQKKLKNELDTCSNQPIAFCLQEVSADQAVQLSHFFTQNHCEFVYSGFGVLGVAVAFSSKHLSMLTHHDVKLSRAKVGGYPPHHRVGMSKSNPWHLARSHAAKLLCVHLKLHSNLSFLLASVHLPCHFSNPAAMSIHTAVALQHMQAESARHSSSPFLLAGDFNFKPSSPQYALATTGVLPDFVDDVRDRDTHGKRAKPDADLYPGDPFRLALDAPYPRSAYASVHGAEPAFTNYVYTSRNRRTFHATLDYIFFGGPQLSCVAAQDLKRICEGVRKRGPSLPSEVEPSDHLMLAADFNLGGRKVRVEDFVLRI